MKEKKNIIKKISPSNAYEFLFRREIKRCLKKKQYKLKKYKIILKNVKYFKFNTELLVYYKNLKQKSKNASLIKKNIYLNCITDGLNLKYDDLAVQLINKRYNINNYDIINTVYSKNDLNIVKLFKFMTVIDKKYILFNTEILNNSDFFFSSYYLYLNQTFEIYKNLYLILLCKIN